MEVGKILALRFTELVIKLAAHGDVRVVGTPEDLSAALDYHFELSVHVADSLAAPLLGGGKPCRTLIASLYVYEQKTSDVRFRALLTEEDPELELRVR